MLSTDEIITILRHSKELLEQVGVSEVGLFGSSARGQAGTDSDIDILLDFETGEETYSNFLSAYDILEDKLKGEHIDVVTRKGLSPYIGRHILNEVVYV